MTKKLLKQVIVVILSITIISAMASISFADGNMAFSVGTNYGSGNINTSTDTTDACTLYGMAGYNSYYTTQPTFTVLNGAFSNGIKRMQSDVLFFSGHGNYDRMVLIIMPT